MEDGEGHYHAAVKGGFGEGVQAGCGGEVEDVDLDYIISIFEIKEEGGKEGDVRFRRS